MTLRIGYVIMVSLLLTVINCPSVSLEDAVPAGQYVSDAVPASETTESDAARNLRERRDGYSSGGYGGYGGGGYGGGSYGCHCPYQSCDTGSDFLLYFAAGALLGLLFSLLQAPAMMMAAPAPALGRQNKEDFIQNMVNNAGSGWASIPILLSNDVAPLAVELMTVYTSSQKEPQCGRRWLCEVTQKAMKHGGLKGRLSSFASVAASYFMKDMMPFLENLTGDDLDCSFLAPTCTSFGADDRNSSGGGKKENT